MTTEQTGNQQLRGGTDSTNLQAGRDVHLVQGITLEEARVVALDVYRENALELRGVAEEVALGRADRITNDYLANMAARAPHSIANLADPDVQSVLFEAQKSFARSGEEDLAKVLVDLLTSRTQQTDRGLRTIVLNEAILSAPKLTEVQRRAIALVFISRYTRSMSAQSLVDYLSNFVVRYMVSLGTDLPESVANYQHIEYVGAGSIGVSEVSFGLCIRSGVESLFTRGFPIENVSEGLRKSPNFSSLFRASERTHENLQVNVMANQDIPALAERLGEDEWAHELEELGRQGVLSDDEIRAEAIAFDTRLEPIAKAWDSGAAKTLTLTSVGIAIGHTYWMRVTGGDTPLSVWLS